MQHVQIGQGILLDHDEIRFLADPDRADLVLNADHLCSHHGRRMDDFQRRESGLAQQMHLGDVAESVEIVDVAGIGADRNLAAAVLVLVDEDHPQAIVLLPGDFVLERPVEPVGAVGVAIRTIEFP